MHINNHDSKNMLVLKPKLSSTKHKISSYFKYKVQEIIFIKQFDLHCKIDIMW